jgi:hypothetical protein
MLHEALVSSRFTNLFIGVGLFILTALTFSGSSWSQTGQGEDAFEPDDVPENATLIAVNGNTQTHNLSSGGDLDWVRFFVDQPTVITVETMNLGDGLDTLLDVYGGDGQVRLYTNDNRGPGDRSSYLMFSVEETGMFYARVSHSGGTPFPTSNDTDLDYTLKVHEEEGGILSGIIVCTVQSQEGAPVLNAVLTLQQLAMTTAANLDGVYVFPDVSGGSYTLTVDAPDFVGQILDVTLLDGEAKTILVTLEDAPDEGEKSPVACGSLHQDAGPHSGDGLMMVLATGILCLWGAKRLSLANIHTHWPYGQKVRQGSNHQ